ncbi:MAG: hypothetical protein QF926_02005 [Alphaproteobacteria bacterium]|jgi:predicted phage tail protein|nr:hypothetical protein [Alphaproteobacteria bacterium]MDP6515383.1 hypothetical protein [Alphaproteobacteria bacterium]
MKSVTGVAAQKAGVKTKLFGVVLIFVGLMNSLLSWRGGLAVDGFHVVLIGAGLSLYLIGSIRQGRAP